MVLLYTNPPISVHKDQIEFKIKLCICVNEFSSLIQNAQQNPFTSSIHLRYIPCIYFHLILFSAEVSF